MAQIVTGIPFKYIILLQHSSSSDGLHKLWIYTEDGVFKGGLPGTEPGTPLITTPSITPIPTTMNRFTLANFWAWMTPSSGSDSQTYLDLAGVRINDSFIGPPQGFGE